MTATRLNQKASFSFILYTSRKEGRKPKIRYKGQKIKTSETSRNRTTTKKQTSNQKRHTERVDRKRIKTERETLS